MRRKAIDSLSLRSEAEKRVASGSSAPGLYFPAHRRYHDMLEEILRDPAERNGIEKTLEWAVDFIRSKSAARLPPG